MLSPLTHPVVRRELVYDKAIQERIDLIRDGSVGRPTLILLVLCTYFVPHSKYRSRGLVPWHRYDIFYGL